MTKLILKLRDRYSYMTLSFAALGLALVLAIIGHFYDLRWVGAVGELLGLLGFFLWGADWLERQYEDCECEDDVDWCDCEFCM